MTARERVLKASSGSAHVLETLKMAEKYKGFAIGCGNSIADYVPENKYRAMLDTVREYRGDPR